MNRLSLQRNYLRYYYYYHCYYCNYYLKGMELHLLVHLMLPVKKTQIILQDLLNMKAYRVGNW